MYFLFFCTTICKSKFSLAFKTQATFKVAVKLQVVGHPTGNAAFVVGKAGKRLQSLPSVRCQFQLQVQLCQCPVVGLKMLANGSSSESLKVSGMMGLCRSFHRHHARSRSLTLPCTCCWTHPIGQLSLTVNSVTHGSNIDVNVTIDWWELISPRAEVQLGSTLDHHRFTT